VKQAQRIAREWIQCHRARLRNLRLQWIKVETDRHHREGLCGCVEEFL
jgi:hypothetical protein